MDFNEPWHKYSPFEWALLKRFSRSEVKGQGHSETKCTFFMAEAYISTVRRRLWHRIPFKYLAIAVVPYTFNTVLCIPLLDGWGGGEAGQCVWGIEVPEEFSENPCYLWFCKARPCLMFEQFLLWGGAEKCLRRAFAARHTEFSC